MPLALLFVALALMALGGTGLLRNVNYHRGMWDHTLSRTAEADTCQGVDVLFIGSSHAYRTFDPRILASRGLRMFNLGSSNQSPLQTRMLLQLYLDAMAPRLLVVEVHPDMVENDGVEAAVHLGNNMRPSLPMARMVVATCNAKAVLSMCYSAFRNSVDPLPQDAVDEENVYVDGGYVEYRSGTYRPEPHAPHTIDFRREQLDALRDCVEMARRRGIACLLVEVPGTQALMDSYSNLDEFAARMQALGDYRFLRPEGLCDTLHFYDDDHLNQQGVELYLPLLCDSVIIPKISAL